MTTVNNYMPGQLVKTHEFCGFQSQVMKDAAAVGLNGLKIFILTNYLGENVGGLGGFKQIRLKRVNAMLRVLERQFIIFPM